VSREGCTADSPAPALPLEGVSVLALSQFGAGPYATLNLADMGAEVIKVEDPTTGGDISRFVRPYGSGGAGLYFESWNRNKRSITLNLRVPEGMDVFHELVRTVDVVFNNLRGDKPDRLGLNYRTLGRLNPRVVCCSLNSFGSAGERSDEPGYDYLMQAYAGYMSLTGDPEGPPSACGVSIIDHAAGFAAALGIVSALFSSARTGVGRDVEESLLDTAYSMLTYLAAWNLNGGFVPQRNAGSAHQTIVPSGNFRTADGYICLFCGKDKFWKGLCEAMGEPQLAADSRFATLEARFANRDEALRLVRGHMGRKTTDEWLQLLKGRAPCAPVRDLSQALADPELERRGTVIKVKHPFMGELRMMSTPVRHGGPIRHCPAPALGADTESLLKQRLGWSDAKIAELREAGAI
jgi:crotonobetainyl-CoA:carnitine CoA-transferase CaiB-like acyl-CoA transferase